MLYMIYYKGLNVNPYRAFLNFFSSTLSLFPHHNQFSSVAQSCPTLCDPWTVARQAPLFMGFSRQEYWSRLPCPPPGHLPDPGIEPTSLMSPALAGGFFTTSATWEAHTGLSINDKIPCTHTHTHTHTHIHMSSCTDEKT